MAHLKMIFLLLEKFLTRGRKLNINVITILHDTLQRDLTKTVIFESCNIVLFPRTAIRSTSMFLKNYMGFELDEIKEVKKFKTKTLYIRRFPPSYMIADDHIKLL